MSMAGSDSLTTEELEKFKAIQTRFGLSDTQLTHAATLSTADHGGDLVFSPSEALSSVPPMHVPYKSMAELKAMIGRPDTDFTHGPMSDRLYHVPAPLQDQRVGLLAATKDEADFDHHVAPNEAKALFAAAQAYVYGNSQKVKHFEGLLDKRFAPSTLAVFSGTDLVVKSGEKLTIKADPEDPQKVVALNYQAITVEQGGQIVVEANVHVTTQTFTAA
jgi:hypothetical protein